MKLRDQPIGRLWVSDASKARWTVSHEIAVGDTIAATGVQSGVFVDLKTLRPVGVRAVPGDPAYNYAICNQPG